MSVFVQVSNQYSLIDAALGRKEQEAFNNNDDSAYDEAMQARQRNDQAYFLYLFTRFEARVNEAAEQLLIARSAIGSPWSERRIWDAWSRGSIRDIAFLSKLEVLTDKGRTDYAKAYDYYHGRNTIAHGGDWAVQFFVPDVAQSMHDMVQRFVLV